MLNKILIGLIILLTGCLEENIITYSEDKIFTTNSLLLREIESRGDFINVSNTSLFPSFISAESLFNNLSEFIIIDVRSSQKFSSGHIGGAVNISKVDLFQYVSLNSIGNKKVVIISNTGQSASYYTYLFRIYGLPNVYSLLFGMASWNKLFENEVLDFTSNKGIGNDIVVHYQTKFYPLPSIENNENKNSKDIFDTRIEELFIEGFKEEIPIGSDTYSTLNTINFKELNSNISKYYIACYGTNDLYGDPKAKIAHPQGAYLYYPYFPMSDIRSTSLLQTFPPEKQIAIYSYSGHLSAMLTAHLRLLGYNAKSILFGGHNGNFSYMQNSISAGKYYAFFGAKNYPITIE